MMTKRLLALFGIEPLRPFPMPAIDRYPAPFYDEGPLDVLLRGMVEDAERWRLPEGIASTEFYLDYPVLAPQFCTRVVYEA